MYGVIGYGTQPYGSFKQIHEGRDIAINASESSMRGAGRGVVFAMAKTASLTRVVMKREFLRFRPKST